MTNSEVTDLFLECREFGRIEAARIGHLDLADAIAKEEFIKRCRGRDLPTKAELMDIANALRERVGVT